ncbi:MAG: DUF4238 domain-containing protein, partial [Lachnospiraceae bacterium]
LWKPHLYTINFAYSYIGKSCPKVKKEFTSMIYDLLRTGFANPVYGKKGYSIIKTKKSINKHFFEIYDWEFYYDDGNVAKKTAINNQIEALNCYIIEDAFDNYLEKNWERTYNNFVDAVHTCTPVGIGQSERIIPIEIANEMLCSFFIMLCRNPMFDAMGVYTKIKENLLYPVFSSMCHADDGVPSEDEIEEGKSYADELMTGIWYSELYKMFFKKTGGFYHNVVATALIGCQMILFEAYEGAGAFITSDNPAFENKSVVEATNSNGMLFPLSPKYLLFIAKGAEGINIVDHRFVDNGTIRHFNRIIARYKNETIIAVSKYLSESL